VPVNQYWLYSTTFPNKEVGIIRHAGSVGSKAVGEFPEGAHYAVYARSSSEKKTAAARLLNFWLNDEKSLAICKLDQGVPANVPVLNKVVIPALDKYQTASVNFVNTLTKIGTPTIYPPPGASEIDALFKNFAEQVQFNAKTPAVAAKEFYEQAVAIRARAKK
jgi:multiple sugar transport system substrate-binding protein